jgi:predicted nucleic-acid-binding protein
MISWDTNFLIRHALADDPEQYHVTQQVLKDTEAEGTQVFLPLIVVAESFWVFRSAYRLRSREAASILSEILKDIRFVFEARESVERAVEQIIENGGDLGDMLIHESALGNQATPVHTFDTGLRRLDSFTVHQGTD